MGWDGVADLGLIGHFAGLEVVLQMVEYLQVSLSVGFRPSDVGLPLLFFLIFYQNI